MKYKISVSAGHDGGYFGVGKGVYDVDKNKIRIYHPDWNIPSEDRNEVYGKLKHAIAKAIAEGKDEADVLFENMDDWYVFAIIEEKVKERRRDGEL